MALTKIIQRLTGKSEPVPMLSYEDYCAALSPKALAQHQRHLAKAKKKWYLRELE